MFRLTAFMLIAAMSVFPLKADPTMPPAGTVVASESTQKVLVQKPALEAILKKGERYIAIIDGKITTERYQSSVLKVTKITHKEVDIEYLLNGAWTSDTLTLASVSFSKKSSTKLE